MIYFATHDAHMKDIEKLSGLEDLKTNRYYRVYGLIQHDNPPVLIEYKELPEFKTEKEIKTLLRRNGVPCVFKKKQYGDLEIGIRKDVREHIFLSAAMCNTLIGYLENKLALFNTFNFGFKRINPNHMTKTLDFQTAAY